MIILEDLEPGGILDGRGGLSAADAFRFYKAMPEFEKVVFSQFKACLETHCTQAKSARALVDRDAQAMVHDRSLYKRLSYNARGEQVFDMHPAKFLLRLDVKNKTHETMVPSAFQKNMPGVHGVQARNLRTLDLPSSVSRKVALLLIGQAGQGKTSPSSIMYTI